VLGIAVGVATLIVVLAVMTGFDTDLRDRIIGSNAHIILQRNGQIQNPQELIESINKLDHVVAASPRFSAEAFLYLQDKTYRLLLRGIDFRREEKVVNLKKFLSGKDVVSFERPETIVLGKELVNRLGILPGQEVDIFVPLRESPYRFRVSGIFNSGIYDYDMNMAFIKLERAWEIFGLSGATDIGVKIDNLYKAASVKEKLQDTLGPDFTIRTWMESNKSLFSALKLEKITMFIILTLIVLVASFNISSSLIVMVTEKIKEIGILKALGVTDRGIRRIFTLQGLLLGLFGTGVGMVVGVFLSLALKKYQFIKLPADIYYIDRLPVSLRWEDVVVVTLAAIGISLVSTVYPAKKAANLRPVEALRYE
jgi:lipoprotein-releasing system permease protein